MNMELLEDKLRQPKPRRYSSLNSNASYETKEYTIQEAIDIIGNGWFQFWIGIVCSLVALVHGTAIFLTAVMLVVLRCEWRLTVLESSFIASFPFLGQTIGSFVLGMLTDKFGRKRVLLWTNAYLIWFSVLSAFSSNLVWFLALRLLTSFMIAASTQVSTYNMEFLKSGKRGAYIAAVQLAYSFGGIVSAVLAMILVPSLGWRYYIIACSLIGLVPCLGLMLAYSFGGIVSTQLAMMLVLSLGWRYYIIACSLIGFVPCLGLMSVPESPYYHLSIGANDKARETIESIAKWNRRDMLNGNIKKETQKDRGVLRDLFATPELTKSSIILAIMWFTLSLCHRGIILLTAEALANGNACSEFRFSSEETCSEDCTPFDTAGYLGMITVAVAQVPAVLFVIALVDFAGRRALMTFSILCFVFSFSLLLFCFESQNVTSWILFVSKSSISSSLVILFTYTPEVYPTAVRGLAVGTGFAVSEIAGICTPLISEVLASFSVMAAVVLLILSASIAASVGCFLPVETKNQQIRVRFNVFFSLKN